MIIQDQAIAHNNIALRVGSDVLFVRYHDDCDSALVELLKDCHDFDARAAVEIAGRLIRKQDLGLINQRPRYGHALLLATRKLARVMVLAPGKSHRCEYAIGS